MDKLRIGVVGVTGYTGIELLKILDNHPMADIKFVGANSNYGPYLSDEIPGLKSNKRIRIKRNLDILKLKNLDLIFSCLPSGGLISIYSKLKKLEAKIIDLSGDFRLTDKTHQKWYKSKRKTGTIKDFQYILPEINKDKIKQGKNISNPGCYATSILLALQPLGSTMRNSDSIIVDAKSGISGAGRSGQSEHSFTEASENLSTYNVGNHRHAAEVEQLIYIEHRKKINIMMVPHLIPIKRGIMSNVYIRKNTSFDYEKTLNIFKKYYADSCFVKIVRDGLPKISDVQNTNFCILGIKVLPDKRTLLISSVIDNLTKGAAGQAVQNMNLLFGLNEELGL
jgi:N-acetyl-gamma-glutamyl-phosphate reductase